MKTKEEIEKVIETIQAELSNVVNEYNFCIQKSQELMKRINYLSGKIDVLKELNSDETSEKTGAV